jgi:hypothetical protein
MASRHIPEEGKMFSINPDRYYTHLFENRHPNHVEIIKLEDQLKVIETRMKELELADHEWSDEEDKEYYRLDNKRFKIEIQIRGAYDDCR